MLGLLLALILLALLFPGAMRFGCLTVVLLALWFAIQLRSPANSRATRTPTRLGPRSLFTASASGAWYGAN